jgi:hypothetical protein
MEGSVTCQFLVKALVSKGIWKNIFSFRLHPIFLASPYKVYLGDP